MYYAYIDSEVDARAWDEIWKKKFSGVASRGLKWENKTYKLKMSLHSHIVKLLPTSNPVTHS